MAEKLPGCKKLPAELNMCTPHIFTCLEDRNANVRQKAQEVLVPYMVHVGADSMVRQGSKLKVSFHINLEPSIRGTFNDKVDL